ncbi:MAG: hypothetical protein Kow0031_02460 [Anaerolineae bacterium]
MRGSRMKITNANIVSSSEHQLLQKQTTRESLRVRVGDRLMQVEQSASRSALGMELEAYSVNLSSATPPGEPPAASPPPPHAGGATKAGLADDQAGEIGDPELRMLKMLFEKVFGVELEVPLSPADAPAVETPELPDPEQTAALPQWGFEYQRHEQYFEAEQTRVSLEGVVNTADGQSLAFTLKLEMNREYLAENNLSIRVGTVTTDPLVINFDGLAAQLTDRQFTFDLNSDGRPENISFVQPGSGFLALDRNGDGRINDGRELFGPSSGSGFAELRALDEDGNHWLDENDSAFNQLLVWRRDAAGQERLESLAAAGVGAIYLRPARSEFSVKDAQNELLGQVRNTGVYLTEEGGAGTIQQVDLAV